MLFSSTTFLFIFLPLTVILYYILPKKFRNLLLLLASILFYAWGEPRFLLLMLITIFINYSGTLLLSRYEKYKKLFLTLTILADVGLLCYFKYVDFIIGCFNTVFKTHGDILHIALPLGISFYTFQAISYVVDVYRGDIKPQKSLYKLALYITLFPQLIAGPIVKYHDIAYQIEDRKESFERFYYGIRRFIVGLSRKVLIANWLGFVVDKVFGMPVTDLTMWEAWLGAICYAFQIYNDFGGYADMAVGLCAMFGFEIKENFNFPLMSKSYTEFWRRWHISLGSWVKEYIYIPLGGNRCSSVRHYFNLFISFFIIGLWHGATANMVLLGLYNAVIVILEKITGWDKFSTNKIMIVLHHLYMIPVMAVSYFLLRSPNLNYTYHYIKKLFGLDAIHESKYIIQYYIDRLDIIVLIIAFLGSVSVFKNFLKTSDKPFWAIVGTDIILVALLVVSCSCISISVYNPFIYFRF